MVTLKTLLTNVLKSKIFLMFLNNVHLVKENVPTVEKSVSSVTGKKVKPSNNSAICDH